jgi:hypothetical protein
MNLGALTATLIVSHIGVRADRNSDARLANKLPFVAEPDRLVGSD